MRLLFFRKIEIQQSSYRCRNKNLWTASYYPILENVMISVSQERRAHKHLRILFMGMEAFWQRVILGRKVQPIEECLLPLPQKVTPPEAPPARTQWDSRLATGIPEVDHQNKEFREAFQRLTQSMKSKQGSLVAQDVMTFLTHYAQTHFSREEAYMLRIGYPDRTGHCAEHARFQHHILDLQNRMNRQDPTAPLELSTLLFTWLRDHIMKDDFTYVAFARENRKNE